MRLEGVDLDLFAIAIGAVVYFVLGAAWYSPVLFADRWLAASGRSREDIATGPGLAMLLFVVTAAVVAIVIALV